MSRAWYSFRNWSGGATPDHAQRKMLCEWFSSSLSCRGEIRGAPLCQFISLTHHILFITRIWFPKPVFFFSLKIPLTIWSWGLIFYDDGDYDYYYVQVCGEGKILSNRKTQAFKHMGLSVVLPCFGTFCTPCWCCDCAWFKYIWGPLQLPFQGPSDSDIILCMETLN